MYCPDEVMFITLYTGDHPSGKPVTQVHGFLFILLQVRGEISRCCPFCISLRHNLYQNVLFGLNNSSA